MEQQLNEKFESIKAWAKRPRTKKRIYLSLAILVALWVVYRFVMVGVQNRLYVFNPIRMATDTGFVVDVINMQETNGVLKEPLTVKNNRALVSNARAHLIRAGQKVGSGVITHVSSNIDLDTGMHTVRTRGVSDGLNYVEIPMRGYFVPSYAVDNNTVLVVSDGVARTQSVTVARSDADTSVITDGLSDGDILILSNVSDGDKVQIKK